MQLWGIIVKEDFEVFKSDGSGDLDKTYKNVLKQPMETAKYADFSTWKTA